MLVFSCKSHSMVSRQCWFSAYPKNEDEVWVGPWFELDGREGIKHITITKYCANTAFLYGWKLVFQHEYISLIWLRQQGFNAKLNTKTTTSYVPKRVWSNNPEFCNYGFNKPVSHNVCRFYSHELRRIMKESIQKCEVIEV